MEKGELAAKIVNNFGVQMRIVDESLSGLEEYDKGLRSRLFQNFDTSRLVEFIRSMETAKLYFIEDPYSCHYCFFNTDRLAAETGVTGAKNEGGGDTDRHHRPLARNAGVRRGYRCYAFEKQHSILFKAGAGAVF